MFSVLCLNMHITSAMGELNEADVLTLVLSSLHNEYSFVGSVLCHSSVKMNACFYPSPIYFRAVREALPHANTTYLNLVLLFY